MSLEWTYYCEGPSCRSHDEDDGEDCPAYAATSLEPPALPVGFIESREWFNGEPELHHFCSWDCAMKYAAKQPVAEWPELSCEED